MLRQSPSQPDQLVHAWLAAFCTSKTEYVLLLDLFLRLRNSGVSTYSTMQIAALSRTHSASRFVPRHLGKDVGNDFASCGMISRHISFQFPLNSK